jgi:hypothetical protein
MIIIFYLYVIFPSFDLKVKILAYSLTNARTDTHVRSPARAPAINKAKWEIWDTVLMGQNLPTKIMTWLHKRQLNLSHFSFILHLNLIQSRLLRTMKAATFYIFLKVEKTLNNSPRDYKVHYVVRGNLHTVRVNLHTQR